jgi:hypothetical protein
MSFLIPGLAALTGYLSNSPANKTTTTNSTQTGSNYGTSNYTKNLTPFQSELTGPLSQFISQSMTDPQALVAPFAAGARDNINSTYAGLGDTLRQQFMGTGGGSSGKFGMALAGGNLQRLGALQQSDTGFAQEAAQLPFQGANLAEQLLGQNFGGSTSTTGGGTSTSSGTTVGPGSPIAGALQGGTTALTAQNNQYNALVAQLLNSGNG